MQPLLTEITEYLQATGLHPQIFGRRSCSNGRLVERLEKGGRVWPETEQRVRLWMAEHAHLRGDRQAAE